MKRFPAAGRARGFSLVEILVALVVAALLTTGMVDAVYASLQTRGAAAASNDAATQGLFALSRIAATIRATAPVAPSTLAAAQANTTGSWLAPVTYTFTPATGLLAEVNGASSVTIAEHVTAFSATLHVTSPASGAVFPHPLIDIAVSLSGGGPSTVTVSTSTRMGGGTLP